MTEEKMRRLPNLIGPLFDKFTTWWESQSDADYYQSSPYDYALEAFWEGATARAALSTKQEAGPPIDRETLGRMVREAWVRWALTQPNPKPSWLLPYDELSEPDKEADRQIGEVICKWTVIHYEARAALSTKQEAGEVSRSQTEASLDQATQAPTATQVVSEALCRNNWSGFGTVCAGVCEACSIPSQPHACEHAVTVWGSDAQAILAALKQEGLVAGAEQDKPSSVCTPLPAPDAGWRTIDSAPRDGTWILIWHKNQHGNRPGISVAEPHVEYDLPADDASERMTWKNEAGYYQIHATHWLPLPAPPVGDGSSLA